MGKSKEGHELPPSLTSFMDEKDKARFKENADLKRKARAANDVAREQAEALARAQKELGLYDAVFEKLDKRQPAATWLTPALPGSHRAIPSLLLTDIHWDESVEPDQVEGYNCYNRPIASMRVKRAYTKSVSLARNYFSGVEYDGFQLFLAGDLLSGIIHEELTETNQGKVCESIVSILDPLESGINLLAEEFGKVNITAVVGNHGRLTKKPRSKFRAKDNFDWLIYKLIQRQMAGRKNITVDVSPSADAPVTLYNTKYRLTHGDQFKGGSGISAELSPLLIGSHRKSKRQSAIGKPYDVLVMGHWHQTLWLPSKGIIMGGSVVGYNEHAYMSNFSPEPPQCSLWLTTPENGITLCAPVFLQDRKAEGW